jgi:hypothetical protein
MAIRKVQVYQRPRFPPVIKRVLISLLLALIGLLIGLWLWGRL